LLDVSRNRIDSVGAEHLSQCVPNLKHLWMQKCNLNASNMQIISNEIMKRNTPVRKQIMKMCSCILVKFSLYVKFSGCVENQPCLYFYRNSNSFAQGFTLL